MNRLVIAAIGIMLTLSLAGCSSEAQISGNVQFDGKPLEDGRILFREMEGEKKAYSGSIKNGKYAILCKPGKMRVEITASRIIPGKFDKSNGTDEPVGEMYIPTMYNSESKLTADVSSSNREHSFDLKSK